MFLWRAAACALALGFWLVGCRAQSEPTADKASLKNLHAGVERLLAEVSSDTTLVLVYDPAQCFTCDGDLPRWVVLARGRGWSLGLLLTREPTPGERDQLRLFRLRPDAVVPGGLPDLVTPRIYRYAGNVLVDSAVGGVGRNALLEER